MISIEQPVKKNIPGWDELPEHVRQDFEDAFANNPKAVNLLKKAEYAKSRGDYIAAMSIYKKLEKARFAAQYDLMHHEEQAVEKVTLLQMGLSNEDLDKINVLTIAMYMACDMIESFALDVNSILRKQDKTASFEMFDPIRKVGKEARSNLSYLWKNTSMFDTEVFNNNADDMQEMLVNKAKKVYRKYAKHVADKEQARQRRMEKSLYDEFT